MNRPANFPKLENFTPTRFMLPTSHYDEKKADRAVRFVEMLRHTKGEWDGQPFWLLPWEEELIRNVFGVVKADGVRQFKTAFVEISKKNGKQLHTATLIPTPYGWSTMGELQVGDQVLDERGKPCNVVAKSDVDTTEDAYRITFRDGSEIIAGARHQWKVDYICGEHKYDTVMTSEEIFQKWSLPCYQKDGGRSPVRIRINRPLALPEADLPLDPYTLGVWLGDGVATRPEVCAFEDDMGFIFDAIPYTPSSVWKNGGGKSWCARYDELRCVLVKNWRDKVIPPEYLRASERQRWELLAGLIDSDGHVSKIKGQAIINGVVKPLMDTVRELLWSLGIKNSMTEEPSLYHGEPTGETLYIIRFTAFDDMPLSKIPRYLKRRVSRNGARSDYHYIESMENIGNGIPMQCIQVDSPSHCYLCGSSMVPTHNSELAAAIALYMLFADGEASPEVYSAACDRSQASIVFNTAKSMVGYSPALMKRCKIIDSTKRIVNYSNAGFYQVLSADVKSKHGLNVSAAVIDEIHAMPNRNLYDVLTKGASDARVQPLTTIITTAGDNRESVAYELHQKARDILDGKREDYTFYPVIYSLGMDEDWKDEKNWYKVNPSLGYTIKIESMREAFHEAEQNPADEVTFRWLRLNQWVGSTAAWIPDSVVAKGQITLDDESLKNCECYGGLDLASSEDITALALLFKQDKITLKLFCWVPEEQVLRHEKRTGLPYRKWVKQGFLETTPGQVTDYAYIQNKINELKDVYNIKEIAFDRWGSNMLVERLTEMGLTVVQMGQGFASMSAPTRQLFEELMRENLAYDNPIFRWMCSNVVVDVDPAGNTKPTKKSSKGKIDGVVATIMALDRLVRHEQSKTNIYSRKGLLSI